MERRKKIIKYKSCLQHILYNIKCVNKYQRREYQEKGIDLPPFAYNSSIVYLEPQYGVDGKRTIMPRNIFSNSELNIVMNDINLTAQGVGNQLVYIVRIHVQVYSYSLFCLEH